MFEKIDKDQHRVVLNEIAFNTPELLVKIIFNDGRGEPIGRVSKDGGESYILKINNSDQIRVFTLDQLKDVFLVG